MLFHACVNKPVLLTNKPPMTFRELKGHIHAQKEFVHQKMGSMHVRIIGPSSKAEESTSTEDEYRTSERLQQLLKALAPIFSKEMGKVTLFSLTHRAKEYSDITVRVSGKTISSRFLQPENERS